MDFQNKQYDSEWYEGDKYEEESEVYQYEKEVYSAMRSERQYIPRQTTQLVVDELDELRRNTEYNANTYRRPIN